MEKERLDPELMGRFYGENNLKECGLEIYRVNGKLASRYAWSMKDHGQWIKGMPIPGSNRYRCFSTDGDTIGSMGGLRFRKGDNNLFYIGFKDYPEVVMQRLPDIKRGRAGQVIGLRIKKAAAKPALAAGAFLLFFQGWLRLPSIPEPAGMFILGIGLLGVCAFARR